MFARELQPVSCSFPEEYEDNIRCPQFRKGRILASRNDAVCFRCLEGAGKNNQPGGGQADSNLS
jgi:hypothetical protein